MSRATASEALADVLLQRFADVGVDPLIFIGGAGGLAGELLDALLSESVSDCETCGGCGTTCEKCSFSSAPAPHHRNCSTCNGSGKVTRPALVVLREDAVSHRELLVHADSLLSLVAYRGAGAVDDEWKADAKELVARLRAAT